MDLNVISFREIRPEIPVWAKAEHMENCTSQSELWKCGNTNVVYREETEAIL